MWFFVGWLFGCEDQARGWRSQVESVTISIHGHATANHLIHLQENIKYNIFVELNQNQSKIPGTRIETYPNDFIFSPKHTVFFACFVCHFLKQEITKQWLWFEGRVESNKHWTEMQRDWMSKALSGWTVRSGFNLWTVDFISQNSCELLNQDSIVQASCSLQLVLGITEVNHKANRRKLIYLYRCVFVSVSVCVETEREGERNGHSCFHCQQVKLPFHISMGISHYGKIQATQLEVILTDHIELTA